MASYHLSVKVGAKGKALPHANYIAREGDYKTRQGEKLEATEHGNMPEWAKENQVYFGNVLINMSEKWQYLSRN
jgi:hypothetical protein